MLQLQHNGKIITILLKGVGNAAPNGKAAALQKSGGFAHTEATGLIMPVSA